MTVKFCSLTVLLIIGYWTLIAESLQITAANTVQDGSFSENSNAVLTCTINPYTGSQTWKVDSVVVSDCGVTACFPNVSNPASFSFTNDRTNGIFVFSIDPIQSLYHTSVVECLDGSGSETFTIIVKGPVDVECGRSEGVLRIYLIYIIGIVGFIVLSINITLCGIMQYKIYREGRRLCISICSNLLVLPIIGWIILIKCCFWNRKEGLKCPCSDKYGYEWVCLNCDMFFCMECDRRHKSVKDEEVKNCINNRTCWHKKKMRIPNEPVIGIESSSSTSLTMPSYKKFKKQPRYFKCVAWIGCFIAILCLVAMVLALQFEECDEDLMQARYFISITAFTALVVVLFPVICVLSHIRLSQGFCCDGCRLYCRVYGYCSDCLLYLCLDCFNKHKNEKHLILKHNIKLETKTGLCRSSGFKSYCLECKVYLKETEDHMDHLCLRPKDGNKRSSCNKLAGNEEHGDIFCKICTEYFCKKCASENNILHKHIDCHIMKEYIHRLELNFDDNSKNSTEVHCHFCKNNLCEVCFKDHSNVKPFLNLDNTELFNKIGEKAESHCKTCKKNVSIFCITCETRTCSGCNECKRNHDLCIALNPKNVAEEEKQVDHCKVCQAKVHFCFDCKMHILHTKLLKDHKGHNIIMALKPDYETKNKQGHTSCKAKVIHYCRTCELFVNAKYADEHEGHEILVAFVPETEKNITIDCEHCKANVIYFCSPCYKQVNWRSIKDHNIHKGHRIVMTLKPETDPSVINSHTSCKNKMRRYCCSCEMFTDPKRTDDHAAHNVILAFETYAEYNHTIHCQKCKANVISFCFTCNIEVNAEFEKGHKKHDVLVSLKPENFNEGYGDISSCKKKVIRYSFESTDTTRPDCTGGQNGHNLLKAFALDGDIANHDGPCKTCRVNVMRFCLTCNKRVCLRCLDGSHEHKLQKPLQLHYGNFIVRNDPFVCAKCGENHVDCLSASKTQFLCSTCFENDGSSSSTNNTMKCVVCKDINNEDATVFCLFCKHYMCSKCFEWHRKLDENWDTADKFLSSTNTTVKREQVLSICEIGYIICASIPVLGIFAIILMQCFKAEKVGSAINDADDGETTGAGVFQLKAVKIE